MGGVYQVVNCMRPTCFCISAARSIKASDERFSKSSVNVLLRDLKLMLTDVTPTVVAFVVFVCMVLIVVGLVASVVILVWVVVLGSSGVGFGDFARVVVEEGAAVWDIVVRAPVVDTTVVVGLLDVVAGEFVVLIGKVLCVSVDIEELNV